MRCGERRWLCAAALGCASLAAASARAQDANLYGVFSGSVGFTDNVLSTEEREADGFGSASPGLVFRYDTPRTSQTLAYTFTADFFFRHAEATSYTNNVTYSTRFVTSPTSELSLGATGTHGQLNTFLQTQDPGAAQIQSQPEGSTVFVQGGLSQGFSKQLSPVVTVGEQLSFLAYTPFPDDNEPPQRTYNLTGTLTAQRLWRHDVGALALSSAYTHFENVPEGEPGDLRYLERDQLVNTLVASWIHDYGRYFSHQLDLGATQATDISGGYDQLWHPAGLAALRYTREEVQAEIAYSHAAALNVFLQQIALVDQATIRAAFPLHHGARLGAEGSLGYQLSQPIEGGELGDPTHVFLADAALLWSPITSVPNLELSLQYLFFNQIATEGDDVQIIRNTVLLTVSFTFPRMAETETRILMTQPFGSAGPSGRPRRPSAPTAEEEQEQEDEQAPGGGEPVGPQ
jgi:hypothetical protein